MSLDTSLPLSSKLTLLSFIICAFQSLEHGLIRKECAPLVSIVIWHNIHEESVREKHLQKSLGLRKAWRAASRRFEAADDTTKVRIRFERGWLFSMQVDFLKRLNDIGLSQSGNLTYCQRFLELLIDLNSQLPTRRYVNVLLLDLNLVPLIAISPMFSNKNNALLRDLVALFRHFVYFPVDENASHETKRQATHTLQSQALAELQRISLKHFKDKLTVLALSNYGSLNQRDELESHLSSLSEDELYQMCRFIGIRTEYPAESLVSLTKKSLLEIITSKYERRKPLEEIVTGLECFPTEMSLYDPALLRNETYDGSTPLAVPKLNLQYLSLNDFLWRSFLLHRAEAFFEIRSDLEGVVRRMRPKTGHNASSLDFGGFSRMGLPISKPAIIDVAPAKVGSPYPAFVRAEVILDVSRLGDSIRIEWESLRPGDAVFLLAVKADDQHRTLNGHSQRSEDQGWQITTIRTAEVFQVLDDNGRALRDPHGTQVNGFASRPRQRRLLIDLDKRAYKADIEASTKDKTDIYAALNVLVRRKGRENNFKSVLETMQGLTASGVNLPTWFQEVFLGYGDPNSARYTQLPNKIRSVDFRDTFLDWQHLSESFPGRILEPIGEEPGSFEPPYVLQPFHEPPAETNSNPSKKRRRDQVDAAQPSPGAIKVSTYRLPNRGPYPMDNPKQNSVRFTASQISAIFSGTQPGLSVVVGPPGTGKTDVATQIINLLYHNFPSERILLVAHSNQALNQLFEKIIALDIDPRHLLRLGHGEEDLDPSSTQGSSYSKAGRVESFLENRDQFLSEVHRLAQSIGAEGAHGNSCETASYFHSVHIAPKWAKYWDHVHSASATQSSIVSSFPFHAYFSNAPVPSLFPENATTAELIQIASGCEHHISVIFKELELIRPFELLRRPVDRANHLLATSARVVAMTSTHAAMNRRAIADLGFHYSSLVMEEAAQITELEAFIPCVMQNPDARTGELALKRAVLVGDHLQNSPVIQNVAFDSYANLGQSLFLRLIRLGAPVITLDAQGRCRPSLAELFKWRYASTTPLTDLPLTSTSSEFLAANAGFKHDYQFINVSEYQGQGEREPSPHYIQNLGEAEYAVALYQYMRLLGYRARSISILATYAGQRDLIRDVLTHRCKGNALFGLPRTVSTVDKYQGEQNDYIILSLVRTRSVGYLRDPRRLTVALSRARLGLYILGRRDLWDTCPELAPAMQLFNRRPGELEVVTGEVFPSARLLREPIESDKTATITGVEHMGQYVYEMTRAKIESLGGEAVVKGMAKGDEEEEGVVVGDGEGVEEVEVGDGVGVIAAEADDDDPLHEHIGGHFV